jgi:hypothetical protein
MKKIRLALKRVRHKLARSVLGIPRTERRIKHFEHTMKVHPAGSSAHQRARLHLEAARSNLKKLRNRHIYLQLLLKKEERQKHVWLKNHKDPGGPPTGFVTFDGHPCPKWIAIKLQAARDSGRWNGYAYSIFRTPEYCRQLCQGICGADSCPGRCAGVTSNHCCPPTFTGKDGEGAVDATDAGNLRIATGLQNHLPLDYPHSSKGGY